MSTEDFYFLSDETADGWEKHLTREEEEARKNGDFKDYRTKLRNCVKDILSRGDYRSNL